MKNILYIQDGAVVNAGWTGMIAISKNGVQWDTINRVGLSVGMYKLNINLTAPNSYPERNKSNGYVVVIHDEDGQAILKFDPSKVLNQAGWVAGTELANATQAVADINTWIS